MQVQITIRGRQYNVRGDEGDDIQRVARDLDQRMNELASKARGFDDYTVALLTALNLASELDRSKKQLAERLEELDREAASVSMLLDAMLPETGR